MTRDRTTSQVGLDGVASVVERLAVLLAAGVAPGSAWGYLADSPTGTGETPAPAARIVAVVSEGGTGDAIGEAILAAVGGRESSDEVAWRGLAAAWMVATEAGAPLAPSLRDLSGSLRALAQTQRDAEVALSGPVATAKLVLVLPLVGVLFGMALGFDTLGTLVATVPGLGCLVLGSTLLLTARAWNRRLLRSAGPRDLVPGLALDLFAIAVSGGASLDRARRAVDTALERCGLPRGEQADAVLELSRRAGVPAGALLRSEAERVRREARSAAERKAQTLAVTLMMPLGLCVLPAFMLLGVAPLMIAVLSSTAASF